MFCAIRYRFQPKSINLVEAIFKWWNNSVRPNLTKSHELDYLSHSARRKNFYIFKEIICIFIFFKLRGNIFVYHIWLFWNRNFVWIISDWLDNCLETKPKLGIYFWNLLHSLILCRRLMDQHNFMFLKPFKINKWIFKIFVRIFFSINQFTSKAVRSNWWWNEIDCINKQVYNFFIN